ncbi:hypothetical protein NDU88_003174 [Pleurodeles waltl]|uniref:Reverse transcriptase n=1 Tax=Pleurodeles waltl TaxID=8319 RepID=A0AAV7MTI5_PLEWA|nr:hypothetical protein NDU88_003174 [Pleurodeles waltl]
MGRHHGGTPDTLHAAIYTCLWRREAHCTLVGGLSTAAYIPTTGGSSGELGGGREGPFTDKEWVTILETPTYVTSNMRFRLIQNYVIQRAYLTPGKINRYFARTDAACPRSQSIGAELLHMRWSCPTLSHYWSSILACLMHCVDRPLQLTCEVCILGLFPKGKMLKSTSRFLDLGLVVAKRLITHKWRAPESPTCEAWARSFSVWASAEYAALRREVALGLRK